MTKLQTLAARADKNDLAFKLSLACLDADVKDEISTKAMDALDTEPENETLDAAADTAYQEYWDACNKIAAMLVDITGGMIEKTIALKMAFHKRNDIINIYTKAKKK